MHRIFSTYRALKLKENGRDSGIEEPSIIKSARDARVDDAYHCYPPCMPGLVLTVGFNLETISARKARGRPGRHQNFEKN